MPTLKLNPSSSTRGTSQSILKSENLAIGYKKPIHEKLNLELLAGELVCLIGPNGAGKSTLIRTLAGMQKPLGGRVLLMGNEVQSMDSRSLAQELSLVLTERAEVGLLTGYALVSLGRHPYTDWAGNLSPTDEKVIRWAVAAVGAEEIAPRYVGELSDGERQKLMIARALAQEPALMILDEPTAFLDLPRRVEMMQLLRRLAHETKRAILLSTHDLDLALRNADKIWLLPKGAKMAVGAPEDLVLNGAFEAAFHSEGVVFDKLTGSFRAPIESQREISVIGEGVQAIWTERALERAGFLLTKNADLTVKVQENGWTLQAEGGRSEYTQLYDLLKDLKEDARPKLPNPLSL
jgi:iron complex transport system ATP-binding protein